MTSTSDAGPERLIIFDEPLLEFANGQVAADPHDGLALLGPYSGDRAAPSYALIGPSDGRASFMSWASAMNQPSFVPDPKKHRLWSPFPGYDAAFGSKWSTRPVASIEVDREALLHAARKRDNQERTFAVVDLYMAAFERLQKADEKVDVAICVVPDDVWMTCRPRSKVANPVDDGVSVAERKARRLGQGNLFDRFDPDQYRLSPDFRRQLKARSMRYNIPVQIIRESTLRMETVAGADRRGMTPLSDRMWNLSSSLYYKAGGKPWKLRTAREGVCYVGIAFRRSIDGDPRTACCAAQMFLDSGDGVVFLGEYGPWYSEESREFHLTKDSARSLLAGVLRTYEELEGKPLREVFLHSRSTIWKEEFAGFQEACPPECKVVGVRVRAHGYGPRLYRNGTRPVLRGTFLREDDRSGYLYTSGFKPRLGTYDGWEVPVPLRIDVQHGDVPVERVAEDIFGLTKLNYNACKLGDGQPVTVKFSDAVGEILISNPAVSDRKPNFRFYI